MPTHYYAYATFLLATLVLAGHFVAERFVAVDNPHSGHAIGEIATPATSTRVMFAGDVFLGRDVERRAAADGFARPLALFTDVPPADALIVNFEAAVPTRHVPTPDLGMQFSVRSDAAAALARAGVTHAGLANNHAFDYGQSGYQNTIDAFTDVGIEAFGHPSQVNPGLSTTVIPAPHGPIGIVAMHTLYGQPSLHSVRETYAALAEDAPFTVAYVHWGSEYDTTHNHLQRRFAEQLVAVGFDLIIGHHPHVRQGVDLIDGVPVVYSLGNTIFDQYFSSEVQTGLLATLELAERGPTLYLDPISSLETRTQPRLSDGVARDRLLREVAERGNPSLFDAVAAGEVRW